ncbi:MAG: hypothetical protein SGI96_03215 [Bacteroidota bacterium]|nr:hypothetical protein [Bacteroidota bacterium]
MQQKNKHQRNPNNPSFQKKVWITAGIFALTIITLLIFKTTFGVFLLVLAGTLIAIFLRGLSSFNQGKTKWKEGVCVGISTIGT